MPPPAAAEAAQPGALPLSAALSLNDVLRDAAAPAGFAVPAGLPVLSTRFVTFDGPRLRSMLNASKEKAEDLSFTVGGQTLTSRPYEFNLRPDGFTFLGIGEEPITIAASHQFGVLVGDAISVAARFSSGHRVWQLTQVSGAVHRLSEVDIARLPAPAGGDVHRSGPAQAAPTSESAATPSGLPSLDPPPSDPPEQELVTGPGPNIDVLILFTAAAAAARWQHLQLCTARGRQGDYGEREQRPRRPLQPRARGTDWHFGAARLA